MQISAKIHQKYAELCKNKPFFAYKRHGAERSEVSASTKQTDAIEATEGKIGVAKTKDLRRSKNMGEASVKMVQKRTKMAQKGSKRGQKGPKTVRNLHQIA